MVSIKKFQKYFESNYYQDFSIIKDLITSICDNFDFYNGGLSEEKNIPDGYNGIISYYLNSKFRICLYINDKFYNDSRVDIDSYIKWLEDQVERNKDSLLYMDYVINLIFNEVSNVSKGKTQRIVLEYIAYKSDLVSDMIRIYNKSEFKDDLKEDIKKINPNRFCRDFFQSLCLRGYDYDYEMFSSYENVKDKMIDPIDSNLIRMPHNLSDNFIYDIFPIFFEKVYINSGLITRLSYRYHKGHRIVDSSSRLRITSPKDEIEVILKKYNINLKWNDIFILNNK